MNILKINPQKPESRVLKEAGRHLKNSGVIAHATETVYGLAAIWNDWKAIQKLANIKQRSLQQPFSIMAASLNDIFEIIGWESRQLQQLLEAVFPGAITLVISRKRELEPAFWNQFPEIGFRFPDHIISQELLRETSSPLITSSANLSGEAPPVTAAEISPAILQGVSGVLDSGPCPLQTPSTVVKIDFEQKKYDILRQGAFENERFDQIFKKTI